MRKNLRKFLWLALAAIVTNLAYMLFSACAHATHQSVSSREQNLREYLQKYVGNPASGDNAATQYVSAFVDLGGGGHDAIVYLMRDGWCGTGGCTMLILAPHGETYRVLTRLTIVQLPIRVLSTKSHGWHDIGVLVVGGGVEPAYEARLSFNGTTYPSNPAVPPARPLTGSVSGKVVIPGVAVHHGKSLYP